jgi:hypothetical protein
MSLSLLPIQDQITTKLKELPQDVYDNGVPEDSSLKFSPDGMMLPFIVAKYAGFVQVTSERGITGPKQDLARSYVEVMCVGPNERSVRQVLDLVTEKLTGFQPTGAGFLQPEGVGKPYVVYDPNSRPVKYAVDMGFTFATNIVVS